MKQYQLAAIAITTFSNQKLLQKFSTMEQLLQLHSALDLLKEPNVIQTISKETGLYGVRTPSNYKILCIIETQRQIEAEAIVKQVQQKFFDFLMNPFVDIKNENKFIKQLLEFEKQIEIKQVVIEDDFAK